MAFLFFLSRLNALLVILCLRPSVSPSVGDGADESFMWMKRFLRWERAGAQGEPSDQGEKVSMLEQGRLGICAFPPCLLLNLILALRLNNLNISSSPTFSEKTVGSNYKIKTYKECLMLPNGTLLYSWNMSL